MSLISSSKYEDHTQFDCFSSLIRQQKNQFRDASTRSSEAITVTLS